MTRQIRTEYIDSQLNLFISDCMKISSNDRRLKFRIAESSDVVFSENICIISHMINISQMGTWQISQSKW